MHIHSLRIIDWMPFAGEHLVDGIPAAPIAVLARYADNPRRSNWAGKTSLLEAVSWCLFGEHRKRLEDGLIHRGARECSVELRLTGGLLVERRRARGGPTKLRAEVNAGQMLEGETAQEEILATLGLSYEDLRATTTFAQGDVEALVGKRSGDRRAVVSRWLELGLWERAGQAAAAQLRNARATLQALLTVPEEPPGRPAEEVAEALRLADSEVRRLAAQVNEAEARLRAWQDASQGAGLVAELAHVVEEGRGLKVQLADMPVVPEGELVDARTALAAVEQRYGVARQEQGAAQGLVREGFDGRCPVTSTECPAAESVRCATAAAQQRLEVARDALEVAISDVDDVTKYLVELEWQARQRQAVVNRYNDSVQRWRRLSEQVRARAARLEEAGVREGDWQALADTAREVRELLAMAQAQLAGLRQEAKGLEERVARQLQRAKATTVAESRARAAQLAVRALGPTGIPARISADSLGVLEDRGNALLAGTGLSFCLAWEREGKELSPACQECGHGFRGQREKSCPTCGAQRGRKRSEELEVLVDDGSGEVEDVRVKSGGARTLVAWAIRLAGGMMLRERRGSRVAWSEVDEPFGFLDAENREGMARCFTSMLGSVGLEQAFIVSHDAALLEGLPARIVITREDGTSRLSLET